ncbi:hypothetical protein AYR62_09835 [Secundilactobacillus paracollinoides]|uniref:UPF0316 protein AYR63_08540 n=1 Tax=Secundilactobacillus paracollinoides TaxID=240427 RepID=A0A1B2IYR5_9LACO|nr:DUF2179 domain-containing protein [Secundilactobacillus paracollinoides]ANZ61261.1 hypothetical protein AYR61_07790 [Secundilactobacillus paracollinoides]ANZ64346.1 hypothetical protein AYR62_09835 [Secundilactobacillus paracollinoides]ANZ67183.1 hypothetical protein AYR63_08540 [Secundilactobacillus paracollinoides]KRL76184.1 hypothetical protein FC17_GL002237 [Secundilactobacillus paracollinoides DSM 15502 = JCM 11969]
MKLAATIFLLNACYITLNTFRTMLVVRRQRLWAPLLAVLEEFVYVIALAIALKNINSPLNVIAYTVGFGLGIYLGIIIEDHVALGYVNFQVTVNINNDDKNYEQNKALPEKIRDHGYGVTETWGYGRNGTRLIMNILAPRKADRRLMTLVNELAPDAFIMVNEPTHMSGGFWSKEVDQRFRKATHRE